MYCAYITTIKELRKHSNADRLQCATIFGNNVIVDLNCYVGQKVIYFPVDGQLSEDFARENDLIRIKDENGNNVGGYLDPDKRNIKALNMRGEQSDGLALPVEVLSKYTNIDKLKDGEQITILNGYEICRKYIPKRNRVHHTQTTTGKTRKNRKDDENITYPFFVEHIDTAQLAFNEKAFKPGDTCYITLKMHGTSARTMNAVEVTTKKRNKVLKRIFGLKDKVSKRYKFISGTRRVALKDCGDGGWYGSNAFREKYHNFFKERLPKGVEVFYEIVGWVDDNKTIMGKCSNKLIKDKEFSKQYGDETIFSYGCNVGQNECYVYRMTLTNEDGYTVEIPWEQVQIECEKMGVKCVPTFEKFIYTTWDDLMGRVQRYYDGADPVGKSHIREGVVVRIDNRTSFTAYKHKNFYFKCLSGAAVDSLTDKQISDMEDDIISEM